MNDRLQSLLDLLSDSPGEPFLLFAIAKEYEKRQADEQALQYYNQLRRESPDYVGLYYHLGKLLERIQHPDAALQAYDQGIAIAQQLNNRHAWSELREARLALADDPNDEI
jgi:tetratricopeptide (TPR) repeat protein